MLFRSPQAITAGTPGSEWGIILMLVSLIIFIVAATMGGLNYVTTVLQARTHGMTLFRMPLTGWGIFVATILALFGFPALVVRGVVMVWGVGRGGGWGGEGRRGERWGSRGEGV